MIRSTPWSGQSVRGTLAVMNVGVLEEVQMPPAQLLPVVRLARLAADRAREAGAALGGNLQVQLMWLFVGVQTLVDQPPRRVSPSPRVKMSLLAMAGLPCGSVARGGSDRQTHTARDRSARLRLWSCGQPPPGSLGGTVRQAGVAHNSTGTSAAAERVDISLLPTVAMTTAKEQSRFHSWRRGGGNCRSTPSSQRG